MKRFTFEQKKRILEIIKKDDFKTLKHYFILNEINFKSLKNDDDINYVQNLIFDTLSYGASNEIIKFIGEKCPNEFFVTFLELAIAFNRFNVANFFKEKINDNKLIKNYINDGLLEDLIALNKLNIKNINYIKKLGFNKKNINPILINSLIDKNMLGIIFRSYLFDVDFIINLLRHYENNIPISSKDLQEIINKEKNKIKITDEIYNLANMKNNYIALRMLVNNDGNSDEVISKRIDKNNILEKAFKFFDYPFIKNILRIEKFGFKSENFNTIMSNICNTDNVELLEFVIDKAFEGLSRDITESYLIKSKRLKNEIVKYDPKYMNLIINTIIKKNNTTFLEYIIKNQKFKPDMDINQKDVNGNYPIMIAIDLQNISILSYLLDQGANLKIKNCNGITIFYKAFQTKNQNIIQCILSHYKNINEKDLSFYLTRAIKLNDLQCVKLIINNMKENNLNFDAQSFNGNTPLILSYKLNFTDIFKYLIKYFDINQKDSNGNSLLYYATIKGDIKTVNELIRMGADINTTDSLGNTILNKLIYKNWVKTIILLLNNENILLNEPNNLGEIPLIIAIKYFPDPSFNDNHRRENYDPKDNENIIKKLIEKGSNINYIDNFGKSALVYAFDNNLFNIAKILIQHGANVNMKINKGKQMSILMYAISNYNYYSNNHNNMNSMIKYLIDNNALINDRDNEGNTPLVYALKSGNNEIANILIDYGADITSVNNNYESILDIINNNNIDLFSNSNNYYKKVKRDNNDNAIIRIKQLLQT